MDPHAVAQAEPLLEQAVERQITLRTGGRVRPLRVERLAGRFVVRGQAPSYYLKQLAICAVQEILGSGARVDLHLPVVEGMAGRPSAGRESRPLASAGEH